MWKSLAFIQSKGCQIRPLCGSDWPQIGRIRDFFRPDLSTFWVCEPGTFSDQNVLKSGLKSPGFVPFGANLTHFGARIRHHCPAVFDSSSIQPALRPSQHWWINDANLSCVYLKSPLRYSAPWDRAVIIQNSILIRDKSRVIGKK